MNVVVHPIGCISQKYHSAQKAKFHYELGDILLFKTNIGTLPTNKFVDIIGKLFKNVSVHCADGPISLERLFIVMHGLSLGPKG